jgi:hypothetical protein
MKTIITKLREYIINLFPSAKYSYCYTDMEYNGIVVFGLCNGCNNSNCPFNCMINDKEVEDVNN